MTGPGFLPVVPAEEFLSYCSAVGRSPTTVETYAYALAILFRYLDGASLDWSELRLEDAARFVEWLQRPAANVIVVDEWTPAHLRGRKPATVNKIVAAMTSFYDYHASNGVAVIERLVTWRHIARRRYKPFLHHITKTKPIRCSTLRIKEPKPLPRTLTPEEVQSLIDGCNRLRDRLLIALLYETGMRIGQALGLRHGDVRTWDERLVITPRDDNANGARTKTHHEQEIQITPELVELHSAYMFGEYGDLDSDYLFVNLWGGRRGQAMRYDNVISLFRALERRTAVKARPHMLRHTHATELLRFGVRTEVVARRLTHASTTTLSVYEHLDQADVRASARPLLGIQGRRFRSSPVSGLRAMPTPEGTNATYWGRLESAVRAEFRVDHYQAASDDPVLSLLHTRGCPVPRCGTKRPAEATYCDRHTRRWIDMGSPPIEEFLARVPPVKVLRVAGSMQCGVETCDNPRANRGWCRLHAEVWRKTGEPADFATSCTRAAQWESYWLDRAMASDPSATRIGPSCATSPARSPPP